MKNKAFTLLELLVVVAIIGILAAVGVVAYNWYTESVKKNVTISNFNSASKFITLIYLKCNSENNVLVGAARLNCLTDNLEPDMNSFGNVFANYFIEQGFKNSYDSNLPGVTVIRADQLKNPPNGTLILSSVPCTSGSGSNLTLSYKIPDNREETVTFRLDRWCK